MITLGLENRRLQSVLIEYTLKMEFAGAYFVVIEAPFTVELEGEAISLSPEIGPDESFAPVRSLIGHTVQKALADENGALRVTFENNARLLVGPDPTYEAWNVSGPDGALVVSTPGGKLAVWSARTQKDH